MSRVGGPIQQYLDRLERRLPRSAWCLRALAGLGQLAGGLFEFRRPRAGRVIGECWRLLDVRRHPWRLVALTCAAWALRAFQVGSAADGDLAGDVVQSGLGKPFLFLGHQTAMEQEPELREMLHGVLQGVPPAQGHVLLVAGTGHDNFTDRGLYFNLLGSRLGFTGRIDGVRALRITSRSVRAFFDAETGGQPSPPLLSGASPAYPEVHAQPV